MINGARLESAIRTNFAIWFESVGTAPQYDIKDAIKKVETRLNFQLGPIIPVRKLVGKEWGILKKNLLGSDLGDEVNVDFSTHSLSLFLRMYAVERIMSLRRLGALSKLVSPWQCTFSGIRLAAVDLSV